MAHFTGSMEEFRRYMGPRLRNVVQTITKGYKQQIGKCEDCENKTQLQSAHIHGKGRHTLIQKALEDHLDQNGNIAVDLEEFEKVFRDAHYPLDDCIRILCKKCHSEYDGKLDSTFATLADIDDTDEVSSDEDVLPIEMKPADADKFKDQLLQTRKANIQIIYSDGREENRPWKADKITEKSNIIGNLRSRPEFRQGTWQTNKIIKVIVTIPCG